MPIRINEMIRRGLLRVGDKLVIRETGSQSQHVATLLENGHVEMTVNAWAMGVRHGAVNIYMNVYTSDGRLLNDIRKDMPSVPDEMPEDDKNTLERMRNMYGEDAILDILSEMPDD